MDVTSLRKGSHWSSGRHFHIGKFRFLDLDLGHQLFPRALREETYASMSNSRHLIIDLAMNMKLKDRRGCVALGSI